ARRSGTRPRLSRPVARDRHAGPPPPGGGLERLRALDGLALLKAMMLIRAFEAALSARADRGFQLFSSGQEATSVGVCAALRPGDQLLASGRSIAPALARGVDANRVMAEVLGK